MSRKINLTRAAKWPMDKPVNGNLNNRLSLLGALLLRGVAAGF